jgi:hypothetical protein
VKLFVFIITSLLVAGAEARPCLSTTPKDLCEVLQRMDQEYESVSNAPYFWSRPADRLLGIAPRIGVPNGLLCYDAFTGGQPKNPDLCRRVAPTVCEWGEDMSGRVRCYEHYEGRMVGGGPINDYLCRQPALCTRENLAAENNFY